MATSSHRNTALLKIATAVLIIAAGLTAVATEVLADPTGKTFEIEVLVLRDEKSVEGANVWMEERSGEIGARKTGKTIGPLTTPKSGAVRFSLTAGADLYSAFARTDQGELALGSCYPKRKNAKPPEGKNHITLRLNKSTQVKGQLFFRNKPVADVACKLNTLWSRIELESNDLEQIIGTQCSKPFGGLSTAVRTDHEGRFVFDGIPEKTEAGIAVDKEGIGRGFFGIAAGKSVEADLELGGKIEVLIEGEAKPTPIKGVQLQFATSPARTSAQGRKLIPMISGKSIQSSDLSVPVVVGSQKGNYRLTIPLDPALPYHFGASQNVTVESEKTTKVILKKIPVAKCSGRIVDRKTGKGVADLGFQLEGTKKWQNGILDYSSQRFDESYPGKTDADGNYSIVCKGNHDYTLTFERWNNQTDYEFPYWDVTRQEYIPVVPHITIADGEQAQFPDVALIPSRTVTGIVKDDSGKPVDGPYQVYCLTRHTRQQKAPQIENGQFLLSQLKPDMPLKFFIRKGKAVNVASVIPVEQLDAPLHFVISEKNQVSCTGKIVDAKGRPIPKATVDLGWQVDYQGERTPDGRYMGSARRLLETLETDAQGNFTAGGLWPRERFYVRVKAKGYQTWAPHDEADVNFSGQAAIGGGTIDFGTIVLTEEKPKDWSPFAR